MTVVPLLVATLILFAVVTIALLRSTVVRIDTIKVAIPDSWALDHHCRAIGHMLIEAPELHLVELYLDDCFLADASCIALLTDTRDRLRDAQVGLSISAPAAVGATLVAHGLPAVLRSVRDPELTRATMLN